MNTSSRFSVLSSYVDVDKGHKVRSKPKSGDSRKSKNETNFQDKQSKTPKETRVNGVSCKPNKKKSEYSDLQALAFGHAQTKSKSKKKNDAIVNLVNSDNNNKTSKKSNKKTKNVNGVDPCKDEGWHNRDEKYCKEENEKCLREAILQSKLEYEEKLKNGETTEAEKPKEKNKSVSGNKNKKKKDKPITVSLNEFNRMQDDKIMTLKNGLPVDELDKKEKKESNPRKFKEKKFFKDVEETTKRTLEKEVRQEQYKEYKAKANKINHEIQVEKFINEIEKRDFEIQALRLEVDSLKNQMLAVKTRNKKLCEVISLSEMRSKGELVVELKKVTKGRDEFSEELVTLTGELEQERTKVSQLTLELKKLQAKRRNTDSCSK